MKSYLALVGIAVATPALASDWQFVARATGLTYYIDASSIVPPDPSKVSMAAKAWITTFLAATDEKPQRYTVEHWEFRCIQHQARTTMVTLYKMDGRTLGTRSYPDADFTDIIPDSVAQVIEGKVCGDINI